MTNIATGSSNVTITFRSGEDPKLLTAIAREADYAITHRLIKHSSVLSHCKDSNTIRVKLEMTEEVSFEKIHDVMVPELEFMFVYNDRILDMEIYNVETE
jgi:hypothetical protein